MTIHVAKHAGYGCLMDNTNALPGGLLADYISPTEVATGLNISLRTLERWHRLREAPARTYIGKRVLYSRKSVTAWLRSREEAE